MDSEDAAGDGLLPGLPVDRIKAGFQRSPGNEFASGKFGSPESSAALAANGFGLFLDDPSRLPCMIEDLADAWTPQAVRIEAEMRFPWSGGRHPWLDATVDLPGALIGIESKRYEPYRGKSRPSISEAYERDVWGEEMERFKAVLADLKSGALTYDALDAAQLVKHAFGLRTAARRDTPQRAPHLVYLYAEPAAWSDGRPVDLERKRVHRDDVADFSARVAGDEVRFHPLTWERLLETWHAAADRGVRDHAARLRERFRLG